MSNSSTVRTAAAGRLQTAQHLDIPCPVMPNSTLNEKLGIAADVLPADTDRSSVNVVVIGYGGHGFSMGNNQRVKWEKYRHQPRHSAMFAQLPFVMRKVTEDLTVTERSRYRLRVIERHNGIDYVCYYGRVLDKTNTVIQTELRQVRDGVTTSTPFEYTLEDMNPIPSVLSTGEVVETNGDYIATTAKVPFVMSAEDVAEFMNVIEIIDKDSGYAVISEFATVSSIDRVVSMTINGQAQSYTEAIQAQITSFFQTGFIVEHLTSGFTIDLDIGNVEPLLTTS